uniref:disintegrin and metalloproteinase domain-containing protein 10-like n=1 Tax=Ciona intestinalis TaxID=7719 RepID=UPI00005211C9|nr:disintegrin and metalloproteinase domain-containing protein 10-like [Ciona intestinalis]|eukprot:XP_002127224.2 disintegrin and metalloproteinase domain-containing protein 10-like [Ciona intestinalis]
MKFNIAVLSIILFLCLQGELVTSMSKHVSYFEHLKYDVKNLAYQHERTRRSVSSSTKPVKLKFQAHGRNFDIHLHQDRTIFRPNLIIVDENNDKVDVNVSHVYHGVLYGQRESYVHGSIISGIFRGVIHEPNVGKFYVEETHQFFGGSQGQSPVAGYNGHSVIYHENDVIHPKKHSHHHCGASQPKVADWMKSYQNSSISEPVVTRHRRRRAVDPTKTTCLLYIQTDHILYEEYNSRDVIVSKIAEHVKAVNQIYTRTLFTTSTNERIRDINFMVQRIRINRTSAADDPFKSRNIGVEKFLDIASLANHNDYCLAYVFTNRDFDNGVLGLAWVGSPTGTSGGICEKYRTYTDRSAKSLNTGIVTFKNYGTVMPAVVTHITFAHELGHNFGSPHDGGVECTPGESPSIQTKKQGNFIMYARATSGKEPNNDVFSGCSIRNMSRVLEAKMSCFVSSDTPRCGNNLIDEGEDCDCGYSDTCADIGDVCCTPADDENNVERRCKLKAGKSCSITQGPCCNGTTCEAKNSNYRCSEETQCQLAQVCNLSKAVCPNATAKREAEICNHGTQICVQGTCSGSICAKHGLEKCECEIPPGSKNRTLLCHTCCKLPGNSSTCKSTGEYAQFNYSVIHVLPGSACENYNGYCDVFSKCRKVDADGPLSRLKKAIFNPALYNTIRNWIVEYWWAVMLMGLALVLLMAGFIKLCSVHTPSNNPRLPKHKQLPGAGTLRRRQNQRQVQQRRRRQQQQSSRDSYPMTHH